MELARGEMGKVKRTYSLERATVKRIDKLACTTRRDKSAIVDLVVEAYLLDRAKQREFDLGRIEDAETVDLLAAAE